MNRLQLALTLFAGASGALAQAATTPVEPLVTQLIVQPTSFHAARAAHLDAPGLAPFIQAAGVAMEHARPLPGQMQVLRLPHPMRAEEAHALATRLVESGVARMAEPDMRVHPSAVPNDPLYPDQWHLAPLAVSSASPRYTANLPAAWDQAQGAGVVVAILDTGVAKHSDLEGQVLAGYDFIADPFHANDGDGRDPDPSDPGDWVTLEDRRIDPGCSVSNSSWHGTHMAGIIGAVTHDARGVAGVAGQARLLPVRVLGKCGGWLSDIIEGLYWAGGLPVSGTPLNPHPARVFNLSLSARGSCPQSLQSALDTVHAQGGVVIVAAGNRGGSASLDYPGNCKGVVNVAATDRRGQRASYSAMGSLVTLSAPGGDRDVDTGILSTSNRGTTHPAEEGYEALYGTSMAAAQVSGVVALMLSVHPALDGAQVLDALRVTATPFPQYGDGHDCTPGACGAGIVRADWAVLAAQGVDFVPDPFAIPPRREVAPSTEVISDPIVMRGLGHATHISVQNGEYSLGCTGDFTPHAGEVKEGQSVCVRHVSAATYGASVTTTVTVGGVSAGFTSTTQATPSPSPGGGGSLGGEALLGLAALALWRRRGLKVRS